MNYLAWQKAITGNDLPSSSYRQLSEVQRKAWEAGANAAIQATRPNW